VRSDTKIVLRSEPDYFRLPLSVSLIASCVGIIVCILGTKMLCWFSRECSSRRPGQTNKKWRNVPTFGTSSYTHSKCMHERQIDAAKVMMGMKCISHSRIKYAARTVRQTNRVANCYCSLQLKIISYSCAMKYKQRQLMQPRARNWLSCSSMFWNIETDGGAHEIHPKC